jgi:hypothetical protein
MLLESLAAIELKKNVLTVNAPVISWSVSPDTKTLGRSKEILEKRQWRISALE